MARAVSTRAAMRGVNAHRGWSAPSFGYNYFATKTKADGFGTWSSIG